ncbi:MAG: hypothetical protein ACYC1C_16220, partial [Chloroflexota bacterium]
VDPDDGFSIGEQPLCQPSSDVTDARDETGQNLTSCAHGLRKPAATRTASVNDSTLSPGQAIRQDFLPPALVPEAHDQPRN